MRLGTLELHGDRRVVAVHDDRFDVLAWAGELVDLIRAGVDPTSLPVAETIAVGAGVGLAAPLRPGKIVAIGLNYRDHVRETGMEEPKQPLVFAKFPSSVIGPGEPIVIDPSLTSRVDWEVELGVVIGRTMRHVAEERALDHVFGFTVANDVSARDVQFSDGQWIRGKSFDTFCPLGPIVVTRSTIADPQALALSTSVNGEVVQRSTTAEMIFGIPELLAYCSRSFTLEPGDLVLTGTPWGCGEFMHPQRSLQHGDVVEVKVDSVGALRNPVVLRGPDVADSARAGAAGSA